MATPALAALIGLGWLAALGTDPGSVIVALIGALGAVAAAFVVGVYRWRRTGPEEKQALITEASDRAVSMMKTTLGVAYEERKALLGKVETLERRDKEKGKRIAELEATCRGHMSELADLRALADGTK